ncbi:MAG: hypothetical protein D3918_11795, partial [Candidatus Electrothrix sp. AX2]|nr:hypothetical protein [Candidatus Electrothrix gigas]
IVAAFLFLVIQFGSMFLVCPATGAIKQKSINVNKIIFLHCFKKQHKVNILSRKSIRQESKT